MACAEPELDTISTESLDETAYATLLPNPDVVDPTLVKSAITAALAAPGKKPKTIVPTRQARQAGHPAGASSIRTPSPRRPPSWCSTSNQVVEIHADGMPAPNGPDRDPFVRVLPRQADPNAVTFGARWTAQDRIQAPLLSGLAWEAHADVVSGAPPARAGNVRRSLRITAMWDTPEDLSIGFTPGFTRGGGREFEHYVTGLEVSTVDKTKAARWSSFVELSGEKLGDQQRRSTTAPRTSRPARPIRRRRTRSWTSRVSRGTTWTSSDLTSTVGLQVHF